MEFHQQTKEGMKEAIREKNQSKMALTCAKTERVEIYQLLSTK